MDLGINEVEIINHGQQQHWIGDLVFPPGVIRVDKSVWQEHKHIDSIQHMLEDGELEVRKKRFGTNKDGRKRKDYTEGDIAYRNFALERSKPPVPKGTQDREWLQDQVDLLVGMSDNRIGNKQEAIRHLATMTGMEEQEITRKV